MRVAVQLSLLALGLMPLAGCYASNVVARSDRKVEDAILPVDWQEAVAGDLTGLFESVAIGGDAALSLRRIYYWFDVAGNYAGAALIDSDDGMIFQTLAGTWAVEDNGLVLDEGDPVLVQRAGDHLRIAAPGGELILRRRELR